MDDGLLQVPFGGQRRTERALGLRVGWRQTQSFRVNLDGLVELLRRGQGLAETKAEGRAAGLTPNGFAKLRDGFRKGLLLCESHAQFVMGLRRVGRSLDGQAEMAYGLIGPPQPGQD